MSLSITDGPMRRRTASASVIQNGVSTKATLAWFQARLPGGGGDQGLTDRWSHEWTGNWRGSAIAACQRSRVGPDMGSSCGEFEEQPWRLRVRTSPDTDGRQRVRGAANVFAFKGLKVFKGGVRRAYGRRVARDRRGNASGR